MDDRIKHKKDAAKREKLLRRNPDALIQIIVACSNGNKNLKQLVASFDNKLSHSGTALLKYAVGNGYLSPSGNFYTVTKRGNKLISNSRTNVTPDQFTNNNHKDI